MGAAASVKLIYSEGMEWFKKVSFIIYILVITMIYSSFCIENIVISTSMAWRMLKISAL